MVFITRIYHVARSSECQIRMSDDDGDDNDDDDHDNDDHHHEDDDHDDQGDHDRNT